MSRFGSAARLASWAGMCPGVSPPGPGCAPANTSRPASRAAGPKGSKWLRVALVEAAKAAARSKGTYLSAQYARIRGRRGSARATIAVGHSILVAAFHILDRNVPYADLGDDWLMRRLSPERHAHKLVQQLKGLGFDVTISREDAA